MSLQTSLPLELGIQILLPEDYHADSFKVRLDLFQRLGFSKVELNIVQPEKTDPVPLIKLLNDHGLSMSNFASGATANAEGLSLSAQDEILRAKSVQRLEELIDFAKKFEAGIILGFIKGNPARREDGEQQLRKSFSELLPKVDAAQTPLILEATNRYESKVANALEDTVKIIDKYGTSNFHVLPDTFHMNIEERSYLGALAAYKDYFKTIHISDNNRYFPGLGCLDFSELLRFLMQIDFQGTLTIEGNVKNDFETDLTLSAQYLKSIFDCCLN